MADNPNTNPNEDCSSYQRTVTLRDWWLIKCSTEFEGKRFGVAGTQMAETGAVRVFASSPIIKAFDVFTLEASDGVCIILRGFLNKQRLVHCGFLPQISREFIFGFPPCWESKCNHFFLGLPSPPPFNSFIDKEDIPSVFEKKKNTADKDDDKPSRKKSLRLHSSSLELMSVVKNNPTHHGYHHGRQGVNMAKSGATKHEVDKVTSMSASGDSQGKGETEATKACVHSLFEDFEKSGKRGKKAVPKQCGKVLTSDANVVEHSGTKVKRKLDVSQVQNNPTTNDVLRHGSKKITAKKESLTSEQRKGKLKVTKTCLSDSSSSKPRKNGNSKKSELIRKGDSSKPMTHSGSKVKDNLSVVKTFRKIDFAEEVTPEKDAKKQKTNNPADSLGQKRSRSGRVLVSPLEFWRNQVPVYDVVSDDDRNLIQVNEGYPTPPSKGKGSVSRKPRR